MFLIIYILFLLLCLLNVIFFKKFDSKQKKLIIIGLLILFSIILALRPTYTKDTFHYISIFDYLNDNNVFGFNIFEKYKGYEYGFIYLIEFFQLFFNNYQLFFFLIALVINVMTFFALENIYYNISGVKNTNSSSVLLLLYCGTYGLLYSGIAIRAGLSLSFGLVSICFFMKTKYIKGIFLIILSFIFHRMGMLFLLLFFVIKFIPCFGKKQYIYMYVLFVILLFTNFSNYILKVFVFVIYHMFTLLNISGFSSYLNITETGIGIIDVYWMLYVLLLILFFTKNKKYVSLLNVAMCGLMIIVFLHGIRAINRVYDYFFILTIPLLCEIYYRSPHIYKLKIINKNIRVKIEKLLIGFIMLCNVILMIRICFW